MSYNAAVQLEVPITKSDSMALKSITGAKSRFLGYADNVPVTVGDCIVPTRFYIMDIPGVRVILGFPFFRTARVSFRYPSDAEGGPVYANLWNETTRLVTIIKAAEPTEYARSIEAAKSESRAGRILSDPESDYLESETDSGNE
jgi:hypothetical protein